MPQDQWQDTLTDAAKTDEQNPTWEIDVYSVICHDAPERKNAGRAALRRPPKAGAYQSDYRTASERLKLLIGGKSPAGAFRRICRPAFASRRAKSVVFAREETVRVMRIRDCRVLCGLGKKRVFAGGA